MSLLLDALKKSGAEAQAEGRAEVRPDTAGRENSMRAAGENLFAAKKMPAAKRPHWGIIPVALIAGGLFSAAGGYYVYREITPPEQRMFHRSPPPAAPLHMTAPTAAAPMRPSLAQEPEAAPVPATSAKAIVPPARQSQKMPTHAANSARKKAKTLEIQHTQEPDSIDLILASAYTSYQNGDHADAWQRYRAAYAKDPKNRDALLGLAAIAQQQGQDDTALHYYRQVLLLDPRDPVAHAGLSSFGGGDSALKESRLKQLISQQPDSAALSFALGNQYAEQSRWPDARQAYFDALALEPANALFAFNLAISLDHLGQRKAAARHYQQALQFDTTGHSGFNRAQAQQRLNELNAAGR